MVFTKLFNKIGMGESGPEYRHNDRGSEVVSGGGGTGAERKKVNTLEDENDRLEREIQQCMAEELARMYSLEQVFHECQVGQRNFPGNSIEAVAENLKRADIEREEFFNKLEISYRSGMSEAQHLERVKFLKTTLGSIRKGIEGMRYARRMVPEVIDAVMAKVKYLEHVIATRTDIAERRVAIRQLLSASAGIFKDARIVFPTEYNQTRSVVRLPNGGFYRDYGRHQQQIHSEEGYRMQASYKMPGGGLEEGEGPALDLSEFIPNRRIIYEGADEQTAIKRKVLENFSLQSQGAPPKKMAWGRTYDENGEIVILEELLDEPLR
jgi:hypothetical protein